MIRSNVRKDIVANTNNELKNSCYISHIVRCPSLHDCIQAPDFITVKFVFMNQIYVLTFRISKTHE